jgi:hypothetical protein
MATTHMRGVNEEYGAMAEWRLADGSGESHRKAFSRAPFNTMNLKRSEPSLILQLSTKKPATIRHGRKTVR